MWQVSRAGEDMRAERTRVLLVMDASGIRESSPVLENAGHSVESATSLAEARARLQHLQFDVVALATAISGETTSPLVTELEAASMPLVLCSISSVDVVLAGGPRRRVSVLFTPYVLLGAVSSLVQ
jgi:CheY-like chemotaxis protein